MTTNRYAVARGSASAGAVVAGDAQRVEGLGHQAIDAAGVGRSGGEAVGDGGECGERAGIIDDAGSRSTGDQVRRLARVRQSAVDLAAMADGGSKLTASAQAMCNEARRGAEVEVEAAFRTAPKVSVDFGVMEHAPRVFVLDAELEWNDLGSFTTLDTVAPIDGADNVHFLHDGARFLAEAAAVGLGSRQPGDAALDRGARVDRCRRPRGPLRPRRAWGRRGRRIASCAWWLPVG